MEVSAEIQFCLWWILRFFFNAWRKMLLRLWDRLSILRIARVTIVLLSKRRRLYGATRVCISSPLAQGVRVCRVMTSSKPQARKSKAHTSRPLLMTGDWNLLAPDSVSVRRDESRWRMAFHARVMTPFSGVREMFTAALILNGTTATFDWS